MNVVASRLLGGEETSITTGIRRLWGIRSNWCDCFFSLTFFFLMCDCFLLLLALAYGRKSRSFSVIDDAETSAELWA